MEKARPAGKAAGGYLEALLQSCPDAVIAINSKGIITFANKAAGELMECDVRELIGKSIVMVYENEKEARETNRKLYYSGGVIHLHETKIKSRTGKLIPVRLSAAHLKDSSGNYSGAVGFFSIYRPWTAAETQLQVYCEDLEARLAEWNDLGAPVFEPWPGLSMAVVVGPLDSQRCQQLKGSTFAKVTEAVYSLNFRFQSFCQPGEVSLGNGPPVCLEPFGERKEMRRGIESHTVASLR